ncbi:MAG: hypothetical protein WBX15_09360 [Thermoanaerobaculia bacterium]
MSETPEIAERKCRGCGISGEAAYLERCLVCNLFFCADCAFKGFGRRFCSERCGQIYFYGDQEDDDDIDRDEKHWDE